MGKASQETADRDAAFEPREVHAGTEMNAGTECEMAVGDACHVEAVGVGKLCGVAVGGADPDGDERAYRHRDPGKNGSARHDTIAELIGALEAEHLLDGCFHQVRICDQAAPL